MSKINQIIASLDEIKACNVKKGFLLLTFARRPLRVDKVFKSGRAIMIEGTNLLTNESCAYAHDSYMLMTCGDG